MAACLSDLTLVLYAFNFVSGSLLGLPLVNHIQNLINSLCSMDGLSERLARCFTARQAEEGEIHVDDDPISVANTAGSYSLIGRVASQKIFSRLSLKMNITRLLQPVTGLTFQDLGQNRFILKFNH